MHKRVVAVPLWFVSVWMMYGLVAYFAGLPSDGGAVLGALSAAFVWMDPTGALWGGRPRPSVSGRQSDVLEPATRPS